MILRGPGVAAGLSMDEFVYGYGLSATLCELADVPVPPSV